VKLWALAATIPTYHRQASKCSLETKPRKLLFLARNIEKQ